MSSPEPLCGAQASFTLVRFLVSCTIANRFPDHRTVWTLRPEYSLPGYKVLLCHHPEYYDKLKSYPINLFLSGHCHGGQIRICNHGIFAPGQGLLPRYHHGVYDGRLVVSSGCANTASIPRFGNEPEVVVVRVGGSQPTQ